MQISAVSLFLLVLADASWAWQSPSAPKETSAAATAVDSPSPKREITGSGTPADPFDLSFDDLKFDIEKGGDFKREMLTETINGFEGKHIRLRGFIRPGFKQSGIKNFVFVRDNQECCFGPGAALYDCVMVKMAEGQAIDFSVRPITVVGTFAIKEYLGKDKKIWAIYRMTDAQLE